VFNALFLAVPSSTLGQWCSSVEVVATNPFLFVRVAEWLRLQGEKHEEKTDILGDKTQHKQDGPVGQY
jgi:hypothetical protein